jgi:flagellar hook-associated protein 1
MSSFVGLYTGLSGIQASQTGIDTVSNNIANANTPGYTRQRVELSARPGYQSLVGQIGTGVQVDQIARLRDQFLDDRFRVSVGDQGFQSARAETLASLENLSGEPDEGLSMRFAKLWQAAETWANDPADTASRRQVLTEIGNIAEGFRTTATSWDRLAEDTAARRSTTVGIINDTLGTIHDLNNRIANAVPGRIGSEVYDQRDLLLDELAALTGATVRIDASGRATASIGTTALLSDDGPATVSMDGAADETINVTATDGTVTDVTATIRGELGGLHRVLTEDIPEWRGELDTLAVAVADAINAVNEAGFTADGNPGLALMTGADARTIALDAAATAASLAAAPTATSPIHDNTNARALADLRYVALPNPPGPPQTLEAQLADTIVGLAAQVRSSRAAAKAAGNVATSSAIARASEHGVSIDEEMVGMVRYQRALEAAARVMTAVDQTLDTLVNRVGIVGR